MYDLGPISQQTTTTTTTMSTTITTTTTTTTIIIIITTIYTVEGTLRNFLSIKMNYIQTSRSS